MSTRESNPSSFPPPTPDEIREAEALRDALEGRRSHPDLALCEALRAANAPRDLDATTHAQLVEAALKRHDRSRVIRVAFGVSSALAMAAAIAALIATDLIHERQPDESPRVFSSRSTASLFNAPFARHGGSSDRIDRIASVRWREFRSNQFVSMGVRR